MAKGRVGEIRILEENSAGRRPDSDQVASGLDWANAQPSTEPPPAPSGHPPPNREIWGRTSIESRWFPTLKSRGTQGSINRPTFDEPVTEGSIQIPTPKGPGTQV